MEKVKDLVFETLRFGTCLSVWFFIIHPIPSVGGRRERLSRVVA